MRYWEVVIDLSTFWFVVLLFLILVAVVMFHVQHIQVRRLIFWSSLKTANQINMIYEISTVNRYDDDLPIIEFMGSCTKTAKYLLSNND